MIGRRLSLNGKSGVVVDYGEGVFFGWLVVELDNGLKEFWKMPAEIGGVKW